MFIDIHVHSRKKPIMWRGKFCYTSPEQLIERYDSIGVEKAVLLPGINPECSHQIGSTEEMLEICQMYPERFIPFCNVDPRAITNSPFAPIDELLFIYKEKGCKGIGEVCANLPITHPLYLNFFRCVEKVGFPLTFHIAPQIGNYYGIYDEVGFPGLEYCLNSFPNLIFLGHSQPFWAEIAQLEKPYDRCGYPDYPVRKEGVVPKLMRKYKNLCGDLSAGSGYNALARDPEYAVDFLNEFQDRLLFGTDICAPATPAPLVDFLIRFKNEGKISEAVFNKIARENALKLLGLK